MFLRITSIIVYSFQGSIVQRRFTIAVTTFDHKISIRSDKM
ncbi:hypothetical protein GM3709_1852 [Geminocystis sp. NIES-3709]|nr:hypothetical protein GM3709_1852 [Geminocystis sp. NIES-3709]